MRVSGLYSGHRRPGYRRYSIGRLDSLTAHCTMVRYSTHLSTPLPWYSTATGICSARTHTDNRLSLSEAHDLTRLTPRHARAKAQARRATHTCAFQKVPNRLRLLTLHSTGSRLKDASNVRLPLSDARRLVRRHAAALPSRHHDIRHPTTEPQVDRTGTATSHEHPPNVHMRGPCGRSSPPVDSTARLSPYPVLVSCRPVGRQRVPALAQAMRATPCDSSSNKPYPPPP